MVPRLCASKRLDRILVGSILRPVHGCEHTGKRGSSSLQALRLYGWGETGRGGLGRKVSPLPPFRHPIYGLDPLSGRLELSITRRRFVRCTYAQANSHPEERRFARRKTGHSDSSSSPSGQKSATWKTRRGSETGRGKHGGGVRRGEGGRETRRGSETGRGGRETRRESEMGRRGEGLVRGKDTLTKCLPE